MTWKARQNTRKDHAASWLSYGSVSDAIVATIFNRQGDRGLLSVTSFKISPRDPPVQNRSHYNILRPHLLQSIRYHE
ncbi:uncharacterized protein CLUP02_05174 [Colletotrichum lupini]|uniref:Uncharacterized protein n=1 Tax=Colletotrichum lupini TaxID=145971 RepID=A0A9Q8SLR2_9PEZI|nr:uncharacterized protein CLUP02_05174 [Colletotrichum lupini]UQC79694.1 hypothetical protein CLUP02_05174 [Colletotrichum lupini]